MYSLWLKQFILKKYALVLFLVVGALTAIIYFSLFAFLWQIIGMNYRVAITITYLVAVLFHFSANRRYTFQAHGAALFQHLFKYGCMVAINYLTTLIIMYLIVETSHFTPYAGIVISIMVNTMSNFMLSRYWVFRSKVLQPQD